MQSKSEINQIIGQSSGFFKRAYNLGPWLFIAAGIIYVVFHLLTLKISPIPWFDETFFASLTSSYTSVGEFNLDIAPYEHNDELLLYGPIYFWITSWVTRIIGFGIFSFRLTGLIASFCCIFIFYKILSLYLTKRNLVYLITAAFALDSLFNSNMHTGRMDSLALFFALSSIYIYLKTIQQNNYKNKVKLIAFSFSGLLFSLALLTTPRIGILLLALAIMQFIQLIKVFSIKNVTRLLVFWSTILITYIIWIFYAFGSIEGLLSYYSEFTEYVSSGLFFPKQQIPLVIITFLAFIAGAVVNYNKYLSKPVVLSTLSVLCFYFLVSDRGQYSVIIAPFQYLLIGMTVVLLLSYLRRESSAFKKLLYYSPLALILIYNLAFFSLKGLTLYIAHETRNPEYVTSFMKSQLTPDSKVVGDEAYYYAVKHAGGDFQYISIFKNVTEREHYQRMVYDYDYIAWSDKLQREHPYILDTYRKNSKLIEIARFNHYQNKDMPLVTLFLTSLNVPVKRSYSGTLYKRIK
ncbi:glycosyltransferase family 39 protein [Gillisia sp. M10.2A]|uniref:Glycosyltransferase family 39 protein n=1 Tax=Gillisia lutea TaxID=2909668 RepID=A0ABS9EH16_9FLAO|nr:glycosyltransferase family 39 protein [Gillisia lutea]MCF4102167.1 glycosyltransferase family 39 protein [Gillisia lutea]